LIEKFQTYRSGFGARMKFEEGWL